MLGIELSYMVLDWLFVLKRSVYGVAVS